MGDGRGDRYLARMVGAAWQRPTVTLIWSIRRNKKIKKLEMVIEVDEETKDGDAVEDAVGSERNRYFYPSCFCSLRRDIASRIRSSLVSATELSSWSFGGGWDGWLLCIAHAREQGARGIE